MGKIYTAAFENVTVSATQDLFEVTPNTHYPIVLHSLFLYNVGADVGDSAEEMLRITVRTLSGYTSGSGGSSYSEVPVYCSWAQGSKSAVEVNNTSKATQTGGNAIRLSRGWNIRAPFEVIWTPETRPVCGYDDDNAADSLLVVRLEASPADAISMSGELTFEEIGA